jgi:hypothetical protein
LVSNFADPAVGVVSGELLIGAGASEGARTVGLYWRYESWIRDRLSQLDSMFGATGPFYAMRRALFVPLPGDVLLDDMFLPLSAFFRGYRLVCDPRARAFDVPTSARTEFTRKVRTLAGNYQILRFYPQLLGPRNRLWGDYVSYKLGRLLLPFALLAMLVGGALLPDPGRLPVLAPQLAGYALALLDLAVPEGAALKRLTAPAATFVTMMVAALGALSIFVVPPRRLWKVTSASTPQALDG